MKRASIKEMNDMRKIIENDERCIRVNEKANAKANKVMGYALFVSLFIVGVNDFLSLSTFIMACLCLIQFGLVAYYSHKFNKID